MEDITFTGAMTILGISYIISLLYTISRIDPVGVKRGAMKKAICAALMILSIITVLPALCSLINDYIFKEYFESEKRLHEQFEKEDAEDRRKIREEERVEDL